MRLERLDLAPYGRFSDSRLQLSAGAALHVVLGANESGKTTTLSAISDLLYGFPGQTSYGFQHDQRLLRVGGAFALADGSRLDIRRRKGNKDTLLDAQDKPVSEAPLRRALGAIDRRTFETEFGLSQRALREGGEALLRAGGSLAETLAAGSASLGALNLLRDRLSAEADTLFSSRRSGGKAFYVALDAHDEADRKLRDAVVTADALKAADAEVREAKAREIDLKARHEETGRAIAKRRRAQRVAQKLARLDAIAAELANLAELPPFAASDLAQARAALEANKGKRAELDRLAAEDARDAAAKAALGLDEALVAQGPAIDALNHELGAVRKAEEDLPRRLEAQARAQAELDNIARRLGLDGYETLLHAAPTDAALARAKKLTDERRRAGERRHREAERREAALGERERLAALTPTQAQDPAPLKRRLEALSDALAEAERLRRERAQAEREARALAEEAAALNPTVPDLDALAATPLPDEAALLQRARLEDAADAALRDAEQKLAAARRGRRGGRGGARQTRERVGRRDPRRLGRRPRPPRDGVRPARRGPRSFDRSARRAFSDRARIGARRRRDGGDHARRHPARRPSASRARGTRPPARRGRTGGEGSRRRGLRAERRARGERRALGEERDRARRPAAMARWRGKAARETVRAPATWNRGERSSVAVAEKLAAARKTLDGWLADAGATPRASEAFEEAHRAARMRLDARTPPG